MAVQIPAVSTEYVHVPVTASVLLDTQAVELAFLTTTQPPDDATTWVSATWQGDPDKNRTCRVLVGPATPTPLAPGTITVWVRVHDTPEIPVRQAGQIKVI